MSRLINHEILGNIANPLACHQIVLYGLFCIPDIIKLTNALRIFTHVFLDKMIILWIIILAMLAVRSLLSHNTLCCLDWVIFLNKMFVFLIWYWSLWLVRDWKWHVFNWWVLRLSLFDVSFLFVWLWISNLFYWSNLTWHYNSRLLVEFPWIVAMNSLRSFLRLNLLSLCSKLVDGTNFSPWIDFYYLLLMVRNDCVSTPLIVKWC